MDALVGDGRIDPTLVGNIDSVGGGLPRSIAARIHLDAGLLEGGIPSQAAYRDDVFDFTSGSTSAIRQALTDTVQWTLDTGAAAVVIDITPFRGGPAKRLLLAAKASPHRLYVSNLPVESPSHTDSHQLLSDDEMVALHFGAYYKLLLNKPADEPLPMLWPRMAAQRGSAGHRPAFCGLAMFSRP